MAPALPANISETAIPLKFSVEGARVRRGRASEAGGEWPFGVDPTRDQALRELLEAALRKLKEGAP